MQALRKLVAVRPHIIGAIEILIVAACFTAGVWAVMPTEADIYLNYEGGAGRVALLVGSYALINYIFGSSQSAYTRSRLVVALQLCQLTGILLLVQAALAFIDRELVLPQSVVVAGAVFSLVALALWRLFLRRRLWNAFGAQRVLFVGWDMAISRLAGTFAAQPALGMEVAGILYPEHEARPAELPQILGNTSDLRQVASQLRPDRIIVAENISDRAALRTLLELEASGVNTETGSHAHEAVFSRLYSPSLDPHRVIFHGDLAARPANVALQSIYTNLLALAALIVIVPLLAAIAVVLRIAHGRGVLEKVECAGLHGIPFRRFRFHRRGRFGAWLARYGLDGLPQAINLVRGEMALIGPRPERVVFDAELAAWIPFYRHKHHVKPGIIGWSQLHCKPVSLSDTLAWLEYDLYYTKHTSVVLDAYIIVRALKHFFSGNDVADRNPETVELRVPHQVGY